MSDIEKKTAYKTMSPHMLISLKSEENQLSMNKNSLIAYSRVWRDFSEFLDNSEVHSFEDFNKSHILLFLRKFEGKGKDENGNSYKIRPSSYNQAFSAIIKILTDIEDDYDVIIPKLNSVKRSVKPKKKKSSNKLFLTKSEIEDVRQTVTGLFADRVTRERNLLIYNLLVHTLMRVDEVAQIELIDIDITSKTLNVRGKGSSGDSEGNRAVNSHIPLTPKLVEELIEYVCSWRIDCKTEASKPYLNYPQTIAAGMPLFTSTHCKRIDVSSIKKIIEKMVKQTFIDKNLPIPKNHGPHCIRRSVATIIYSKKKDIVRVQKLLRHASPVTTMEYIGVSQDEVNKDYLEGISD